MTDDELCGALKAATDGLLYMSESDYPIEVVRWDGSAPLTPEYLRAQAGADASAQVEESTPAEFFRVPASEAAWKNEAQLAEARKYQALRRLLEESLTSLKAYRVGDINIMLFVVGISAEENRIGVSTRVVET